MSRLATVGTEPDASEKKLGIAKRATNALKGIAETLTNTSKLATACEGTGLLRGDGLKPSHAKDFLG